MKKLLIILISIVSLAGVGHAQALTPEDDPNKSMDLVLESHVGSRPRDADYLLAPLLDELKRSGFRGSSVAGTRIHSMHSVSSKDLSAKQLAQVRQAVKEGHSAYLDFHFKGAITAANRGVIILLSHPATMVKQQDVREYLYEALIIIGLANSRLGNKVELTGAMSEFLRSFPKREVSNKDYGPEGKDLYRNILRYAKGQKKGELQIAAAPGSMIFINETYRGMGAIKVKLIPGRYRIYTQNGANSGRVHMATVVADRIHTLVVDPLMDRALRTSGNMVGFVFDSEEARAANEKRVALALGRALGAQKLVLIGFHKFAGKDSIVASSLLVAEGDVGASARVPLPSDGAPSAAQLRALAAFVAGSKPASSDIEVLTSPQKTEPQEPEIRSTAKQDKSRAASRGFTDSASVSLKNSSTKSSNRGGLTSAWRWSTWTLGVAGIGVGSYLISIDGSGTCGSAVCPNNYETRVPGIAAVASGVVLGTLGFYLWAKEGADGNGDVAWLPTLVPSAGGLAAAVLGRF